MIKFSEETIVRYIDQTNLKPDATTRDISSFVEEAREYGFCSVAIMPSWIPLAKTILDGGKTTIVGAIGFPLGTCTTSSKVAEARWAIKHGPEDVEIDMVMNVPFLKSGQYGLLEKDIRLVVEASESHIVKLIIEVPILTKQEIVIASLIAGNAGVDYVKTSTGFKHFKGWRPSTVDDVLLIKSVVGDSMKIKVSGGISTLTQSLRVIKAGASRIGTSSGVAITNTFRSLLSPNGIT
jgi:deoxyribose-phosphate aldolase